MTVPDDDEDPAPERPSSPACSMAEADDAYMGFATAAEVAAFLRELDAAQREGRPWTTLARRMLPRLRDDRLHAAIAARLEAAGKTGDGT